MISLACPWCDENAAVDPRDLSEAEADFTCPECGTSVAFVEESAPSLELAA